MEECAWSDFISLHVSKKERGFWEGIEQTNISLTIVLELTRFYYLDNQVHQEIYNGYSEPGIETETET